MELWENYNEQAKEHARTSALLDQTLRELCKTGHSDYSEIKAKVWLIGRGFASGIERRMRRADGDLLNGLEQLINALHRSGQQLDHEVFKPLQDIQNIAETDQAKRLLELHRKFIGFFEHLLLKSKSESATSAPSFAAKYMHFHNPQVPIYDSQAARALQHVEVKRLPELTKPQSDVCDKNYSKFLARVVPAYRALPEECSVRLLDLLVLVYYRANNGWPTQKKRVSRDLTSHPPGTVSAAAVSQASRRFDLPTRV